MKWVYKAIIQKVISYLPFSNRINYYFQRYITVGKELPVFFVIDRIKHAKKHISNFNKYGKVQLADANVLEIGTGWYPIVPIFIFLSGANNIETFDVQKHYCKMSVNQTIKAFLNLYENDILVSLIPNIEIKRVHELKNALNDISTIEKLKIFKIESTICKSKQLKCLSGDKDLIISNNTIQFVEKKYTKNFFLELIKIGKNTSIISFFIDLTDEFSHSDNRISNFNFYKFSDFKWKMLTNRYYRQNRIRYSDYKTFLLNPNFSIIEENVIKGEKQQINNIKINKLFSHYKEDDLLIKSVEFVVKVIK